MRNETFTDKVSSLIKWFEEAIPLDRETYEWDDMGQAIAEGLTGNFYNVELVFHLNDGSSVSISNHCLEVWRKKNLGYCDEYGYIEGDDFIEIGDKVIPFSSICYVESICTDIDWEAEIKKLKEDE